MAGKDYYLELPLHALTDPAMLRLMQRRGMEGVGCYVGMCAALTIAYNEGRGLRREDVEGLAFSWHMEPEKLEAICDDMAEFGLISAEMWRDPDGPSVGIDFVAERRMYRMKRAEAGRAGMSSRWGKKKEADGGENVETSDGLQ